MSRKRKCVKCKKVKSCRIHTDKCKNGIQPLCLDCGKKIARKWYDTHRTDKCQYQAIYRRHGAWLRDIKKRFSDLTEEEKIKLLFV